MQGQHDATAYDNKKKDELEFVQVYAFSSFSASIMGAKQNQMYVSHLEAHLVKIE